MTDPNKHYLLIINGKSAGDPELREAVAAEGFRTRVYVPIGEVIPGMAYLVRRLLENTSNQSWFIREESVASPEELLAPPRPSSPRRSAAPPSSHARAPRPHHHLPVRKPADTRTVRVSFTYNFACKNL